MCNSLPTISFCLASILIANESARHQTLFIVRCKQYATRRLCSDSVSCVTVPQKSGGLSSSRDRNIASNNKQNQVLLTLHKVERCAYFCSQHLLYTKSTGQHTHETKRSGIQLNTSVQKEHKYQRRKTPICQTPRPSRNFTPKNTRLLQKRQILSSLTSIKHYRNSHIYIFLSTHFYFNGEKKVKREIKIREKGCHETTELVFIHEDVWRAPCPSGAA